MTLTPGVVAETGSFCLLSQLERKIQSVSGWWVGDSQRAFVDEFNKSKNSKINSFID
jgi:uncharacterized protein YukE